MSRAAHSAPLLAVRLGPVDRVSATLRICSPCTGCQWRSRRGSRRSCACSKPCPDSPERWRARPSACGGCVLCPPQAVTGRQCLYRLETTRLALLLLHGFHPATEIFTLIEAAACKGVAAPNLGKRWQPIVLAHALMVPQRKEHLCEQIHGPDVLVCMARATQSAACVVHVKAGWTRPAASSSHTQRPRQWPAARSTHRAKAAQTKASKPCTTRGGLRAHELESTAHCEKLCAIMATSSTSTQPRRCRSSRWSQVVSPITSIAPTKVGLCSKWAYIAFCFTCWLQTCASTNGMTTNGITRRGSRGSTNPASQKNGCIDIVIIDIAPA